MYELTHEDLRQHFGWCLLVGSSDPTKDTIRFINTFSSADQISRLVEALRTGVANHDK